MSSPTNKTTSLPPNDAKAKWRKFREDTKQTFKKMEKGMRKLGKGDEYDSLNSTANKKAPVDPIGLEIQHEEAQAIHGSLANVLPLLDAQSSDLAEKENNLLDKTQHLSKLSKDGNTMEVATEASSRALPRWMSTSSGLNRKIQLMLQQNNDSMAKLGTVEVDDAVVPPGELRLQVLEWMYDERGEECPALHVSNFVLFEDLVPVFVNVILFGKSDFIRNRIWAFLLECASSSTHFAFLVVCNLYSLQCNVKPPSPLSGSASAQPSVDTSSSTNAATASTPAEELDDMHKIENAMEIIKQSTVELLEASGAKASKTTSELSKAVGLLQEVHDAQLIGRLFNGPTRANIEMLVEKVRKGIVKNGSQESLDDLDGKLAFVKSLTDLDDWLIRSCAREERQTEVKTRLKALDGALSFGAYIPTAVANVGTGHRLLRIAVDETIVFNTAHKCPFLLVAEVQRKEDTLHDRFKSKHTAENDQDPKTLARNLSTVMLKNRSVSEGSYSEFESHAGESVIQQRASKEMELTKQPARGEDGKDDSDTRSRRLSSLDIVLAEQQDGDQGKDEEAVGKKSKSSPESWEQMVDRVRKTSDFGSLPGWDLCAMFVKAGDDLRQQQLGLLMVSTFQKIFLEEGVPVWLSPYNVIATSPSTGLLEPARNSDSIARIKERGGYSYIDEYFRDTFGKKDSRSFKRARKNFLTSLAGYSIISYLLKLHDRHNGNILIDTEGHILHIDFGFMLGHYHQLERSPFKLTKDMVRVLGGPRSKHFQQFRRLMEKAYIAASKHEKEVVLLVHLMSVESPLPCFAGGRRWVIDELRGRLNPGLSNRQLRVHINDMIDYSLGNLSSRCYDKFQRCVNGIY